MSGSDPEQIPRASRVEHPQQPIPNFPNRGIQQREQTTPNYKPKRHGRSLWATVPERLTVNLQWSPPTGNQWAGRERRDWKDDRRAGRDRCGASPTSDGIVGNEPSGSTCKDTESDTTVIPLPSTMNLNVRISQRDQEFQEERAQIVPFRVVLKF